MSSEIKQRVEAAVKDAMRARDKQRLGVLRLIMADFKKIEVDERIELDDTRVLAILDKMTKQRKDSLTQYESAGRQDLVDQEAFEIAVLQEFLPAALSEAEISELVAAAVSETGASSMQDMGNVMAILRPQVQGRADMGQVSALVKAQLG
ncbi:MAG: GatB/YqeY domain-containing protein [Pseudomonadales bacterium]|nr:GatB/YqeY domain-containing protein [Pseudomonadales bacterium]